MSPTPETIENLEKTFAKEAGGRAMVHSSKTAAAIVPQMDAANNIVPYARKAAGSVVLEGSSGVLNGAANVVQQPTSWAFGAQMVGMLVGGLGWVADKIPFVNKAAPALKETARIASIPNDWMMTKTVPQAAEQIQDLVVGGLRKAETAVGKIGATKAVALVGAEATSHAGEIAAAGGAAKAATFLGNRARNVENLGATVNGLASKAGDALSKLEISVKAGDKAKTFGGESLGKAVSSAPAAIGNALQSETVMSASFKAGAVLGSGAQIIGATNTFKARLDQLAEMYADMKGVDANSVSPLKMIFAPKKDLPLLVVQERDKIVGRMAPAALIQAANAVLSFKMASMFGNSNGGQGVFGLMGAQMATAGITNLTMPHSAALDLYDTMKDVYANTGALPKDLVAVGLATMAPSLRAVGANNAYTKALAEEYAAAHITPAQLMQKIESGAVAADLFCISSRVEAALPPVKHPAAKVSAAQSQGRVSAQQLAAGAGVA